MTEITVLRNELNSPILKLLTDAEFHSNIIDILTEVKFLTGFILYEDREKMKVQLRVIKRYLRSCEKFMTLTTNEVLHAFYMNQQGLFSDLHKHYNRELNCEFIGDVLLKYITYKKFLYDRAGQHITNLIEPPQVQKFLPLGQNDWENLIQEDYEKFQHGDTPLIRDTTTKYFFLRRRAMLQYKNRLEYWDWYWRALTKMERDVKRRNTATIGSSVNRKKELEKYDEIRKTGMISRVDHISISHLLRRGVYLNFLEEMSGRGVANIFSEIEPKQS